MSKTRMWTWTVPDLRGVPPSSAVSINLSSGCSSRSSALSSTSSGYFLPSLRLRVRTWKWELGVIV
uniref:Uncharacterized protein n=1 Tax=Monodon monoceros TaxID=40151 RepID=A0A8C6AKZ1_MONMO